jgi:hypothetical protein
LVPESALKAIFIATGYAAVSPLALTTNFKSLYEVGIEEKVTLAVVPPRVCDEMRVRVGLAI